MPTSLKRLSLLSFINRGCSSRHDTHHEPHTLSSVKPPFIEALLILGWASSSAGKSKAGSGAPSKVEGITCGSWLRPITNTPPMTANSANGRMVAGRSFMRLLLPQRLLREQASSAPHPHEGACQSVRQNPPAP